MMDRLAVTEVERDTAAAAVHKRDDLIAGLQTRLEAAERAAEAATLRDTSEAAGLTPLDEVTVSDSDDDVIVIDADTANANSKPRCGGVFISVTGGTASSIKGGGLLALR